MASKSKRRRKVLGASCILAALIIAGSSFAWFTSKDEVINRLSAQADYGVSIVESFAPPANWLPGQEVNKDVYAVNTGNVDAFVEETVSGVLTITTEKAVAGTTPTAKSIKLNAAERYVVEAGSYLAWAPDASNHEQGEKVVAMVPDSTDLTNYTTADATTDFTPDAAGLYVFRRSIGVNDDKSETFKYDGYYFDGKDYYKISDLKVTPDGASYAGDNDTTDGNLTSATAGFYEEETVTAKPTLTYDAANKRLVATYDTGKAITNADLGARATAYDNALIAYNDAIDEYTAALNDDDKADADVVAANTALQTALNKQRKAANDLAKAERELQEAIDKQTATAAALAAAEAARGEETDAASNAANASAWAKYNYAKAALGEDTDAASNAANASAWAKYNYALSAKNTAEYDANTAKNNLGEDGRKAYLKYVRDNITGLSGYTDEQTETWLDNTATYDQLSALEIDATKVGYNYHQLLVTLKEAERDLETAAQKLADAQSAEALAKQKKDDADAAKTAAKAELGDSTDDATKDTAYGRVAKAKEADDAAKDGLGESTDDSTKDTAYGRKKKAEEDKADADAELGEPDATDTTSAYGKYNNAVNAATGDPSTSTKLKTAQDNLAKATQALAEAEEAYNSAMNVAEGKLKININLADVTTTGEAGKWQLLPDPVNGDTAYFYYNSILGAGLTSAQLIDSVELDSSVTDDMFKSFDFDLKVGLKSAQITYDADGEITTDATNELDANAAYDKATGKVAWTLK